MTQYLFEEVVELLNYLTYKNKVSETISASMIVEMKVKIDMGLKMEEFGACAMVYAGTTNTMKRRSVPEIVLKASNETGLF